MKKLIIFLVLTFPLILQAQIRVNQIRGVDANNSTLPAGKAPITQGDGTVDWGDIATGGGFDDPQTLTYATDPVWDVSVSNNRTMTLTGNVDTLYITNIEDGEQFQLELTQDATGGYGIEDIVFSTATTIYYPGVKPIGSNIESSANQSTIISGVRFGNNIHIGFKYVEPNTSLPRTAEINVQTGTTYTLQTSDNGKIVTLNNASAVTVTVPSGLGSGFNCTLIQLGVGTVSVSASGTTINNRNSHTSIAGQYGSATLLSYTSNSFLFQGDTQ